MEGRKISNDILKVESNEFGIAKDAIKNSIDALIQAGNGFNEANSALENDWIGKSGEQFKTHNDVLSKMLKCIVNDLNTEISNLGKIEENVDEIENKFKDTFKIK